MSRSLELLVPAADDAGATNSGAISRPTAGARQPLLLLIEELRTVATDWRMLMLRLGLKQYQLNEIDCDHHMVRDKLVSALNLWLRAKKGASWMDVVTALRGVGEEVLASKIEEKYGSGSLTATTVGLTLFSRRKPGVVVKLNRLITSDKTAMFTNLVVRISAILNYKMSLELDQKTNKDTFRKFRQYVAHVFVIHSIQQAINVEEIFNEINAKWCWDLDGDPYDMLLTIVKGLEDLELMAELVVLIEESQAEHYRQYLVATKVADHIVTLDARKLEDGTNYEPNFDELSVKLDDLNVDECSMAYLTDLWKAIRLCFRPPILFSVLADIQKGCLSVTWLVPTYAFFSLMMLPQSSTKTFSTFHIMSMTINGSCYYEASSISPGDTQDGAMPQVEQQQPITSLQPTAAQAGYDVQLVNVTNAYKCIVCHLVPRDPMQVNCCGKRFCKACITHVLSEMKACPHCRAESDTIQVFDDEGHRQAILELQVYCPNMMQGCVWTGELCHIDDHVTHKCSIDAEDRSCQFSSVVCIHCSEVLPRHHMRSCPLMPYTCPHCKHYSASYRDVINHHLPKCIKNKDITIGYQKGFAVPAIDGHRFRKFVPPPTFIMTNLSKKISSGQEWTSPPFYSHIGGYKMCLMVDANGYGSGAFAFMSVFVSLMRGEYDGSKALDWPFRGFIKLQLINRRADSGHVEMTVRFIVRATTMITDRVTEGKQAHNVTNRVMDSYVAPEGSGRSQSAFIPHSALRYNKSWNTEYLKNNSMEFRVTQVEIAELDDRSYEVQSDQPVLLPVTMIMRGFISHMIQRVPWFSPPFDIGGYKMCLRVDANGTGSNTGAHLSAGFCLMRGEYDDDLSWPFRRAITLQMINQRTDKGHVEETIYFDDRTPGAIGGQVSKSEEVSDSWGKSDFVSHAALHYNKQDSTEYLKNNSLVFQVKVL